jgi:serine phosphatase RsbU (regulator of sigma subunit)
MSETLPGMNIYAALARGESLQIILPPLAESLGADIVMLIWKGEEEAHISFQNASFEILEDLKARILQELSPASESTTELFLAENQLRKLRVDYAPGEINVHPISFDDETLGAIGIIFPQNEKNRSATSIPDLLVALGIAHRIDQGRRSNEEAIDRLDRMAMVGRIFTEALSLDRTLVRLLEVAVDLVGTGVGVFVVRERPGEENIPPVGWGLPSDWIKHLFLKDGKPLIQTVLETGRPLLFPNVDELKSEDLPKFLQSLVIIPLSYEGGTLGCLCLPNPPPRFFEIEAEQRALGALASLAGGAIRGAHHLAAQIRAERLREEVRLAAHVQTTLLPRELPETDQLEASAIMRPALHLGGDFYDMIDLGDGKWGIMIADVSGKGPAAAMLMTTARAYLHAFADGNLSAGEVLNKLNHSLVRDLTDGKFLTATYLLLNIPALEIQIAGAGHHPLFIIEPSRRIKCIPCEGLPLGIIQHEDFPTTTIPIQHGSTVLLYTDGLVEAKGADGKFFGSEGMYASMKSAPLGSSKAIIEGLMKDVEQWLGKNPPSDDLTVLAVHVK